MKPIGLQRGGKGALANEKRPAEAAEHELEGEAGHRENRGPVEGGGEFAGEIRVAFRLGGGGVDRAS